MGSPRCSGSQRGPPHGPAHAGRRGRGCWAGCGRSLTGRTRAWQSVSASSRNRDQREGFAPSFWCSILPCEAPTGSFWVTLSSSTASKRSRRGSALRSVVDVFERRGRAGRDARLSDRREPQVKGRVAKIVDDDDTRSISARGRAAPPRTVTAPNLSAHPHSLRESEPRVGSGDSRR
ncbi:hypothetical protein DMC30DRAFT_388734 [Rhodotorula diobovata]|uniref:Uncharacterized protein n=1 Tax=Rhodotorula diobovata TaxID=5288 RepID=A0A5C5G439_9BASI|nr:hypothetical protein DMC30DRAFT_388734 [Rhodotorula diobovata]